MLGSSLLQLYYNYYNALFASQVGIVCAIDINRVQLYSTVITIFWLFMCNIGPNNIISLLLYHELRLFINIIATDLVFGNTSEQMMALEFDLFVSIRCHIRSDRIASPHIMSISGLKSFHSLSYHQFMDHIVRTSRGPNSGRRV